MIPIALFDMPNSNRFDILSISIFSEISLSILISIMRFFTVFFDDFPKEIFENIDIDKISNRLEFGISNRATRTPLITLRCLFESPPLAPWTPYEARTRSGWRTTQRWWGPCARPPCECEA